MEPTQPCNHYAVDSIDSTPCKRPCSIGVFSRSALQVLFEVLDRLKDPADLPKCVKDITADLRSSTDDKPSLRSVYMSSTWRA